MKVITTLTNEQVKLFHVYAAIITDDYGRRYYHIPFFFKDLGHNEFEVLKREELRQDVKDFIKPEIPE